MIVELANESRGVKEIARTIRRRASHVREVMAHLGLPRLPAGARPGANNHQFLSGRRVTLDGYVLVTAPMDHPYARRRTNRRTKLIYEHRLALEQKLGRYLLPGEVTDHIDGLALHNAPENLRVFATNAEHLRATLSGKTPGWSASGMANFLGRGDGRQAAGFLPVDIYYQRRARGEIRLRQILLAALSLGTESPFLLGTRRWTMKAGIDMSSRPTIERALAGLYAKWESDRAR